MHSNGCTNLQADYARYVPWLPYPKLGVAEFEPPKDGKPSWDFTAIDPMTIDFLEATKGHSVILNFTAAGFPAGIAVFPWGHGHRESAASWQAFRVFDHGNLPPARLQNPGNVLQNETVILIPHPEGPGNLESPRSFNVLPW
jgi:hypothetical protein